MSRVAWLDCSVAAAGDMFLAALLDAGADEGRLRAGLEALGLDGWTLHVGEVRRGAFRALRAEVRVAGQPEGGGPEDGTEPPLDPAHHPDAAHHHHRHYGEIRALLQQAPLQQRVRARALAAYERLAQAEAALHGVPLQQVALHEVGSTDAIVDIVGVCLALEDLGVEQVVATPLPMGTGRIQAAHGALPLPAPATLEVLRGWPVVPSPWPGEWVTPTGAALVSALATPGPFPAMVPATTGHGAGRKDPPQVANLVRVVVGEAGQGESAQVAVLACNLDDMLPEHVPPLIERLLATGALDAWASPVAMKKGRPGLVVEVLAPPAEAQRLAEVLLRHSSTLGVRQHLCSRQVLERWVEPVSTPYGTVRMKVGGRHGSPWHASPEFEDVAARAAEAGVPLPEVHRAAVAAWKPGPR